MAKTIDDLQTLLTSNGYSCQRMLDVILATTVATEVYKNPAGQKALEFHLSIDRPNDCVAVEVVQAFDLRATEHAEATLRCLMTASGRTPLVRPALEPEGDIKLRVDCARDADGARDGDVITALNVLYQFANAWYPQVEAAMRKGKFDPSKVIHLNLTRLAGGAAPAPPPSPADDGDEGDDGATAAEATPDKPDLRTLFKAAAISTKPGGHPNRLRALFDFHRRGDGPGHGPSDQN